MGFFSKVGKAVSKGMHDVVKGAGKVGKYLPIVGPMYTGAKAAKQGAKAQQDMAYQQKLQIADQTKRANAYAKSQKAEKTAALRKISQGRIKSARRRNKGAMFGDAVQEGYAPASRLGGY